MAKLNKKATADRLLLKGLPDYENATKRPDAAEIGARLLWLIHFLDSCNFLLFCS
jgi:hypothetical protein